MFFKKIFDIDFDVSFECFFYDEVMCCFGVDNFDFCFGFEIMDFGDYVKDFLFKVFLDMIVNGGVVCVFCVKGGNDVLSCKDIDVFEDFVKIYGVKGFVWFKVNVDGWSGGVLKFFFDDECVIIVIVIGVEVGDLLFMVVVKELVICVSFG